MPITLTDAIEWQLRRETPDVALWLVLSTGASETVSFASKPYVQDATPLLRGISTITREVDLATGLSKISTVIASIQWDEQVKDLINNKALKKNLASIYIVADPDTPVAGSKTAQIYQGSVFDFEYDYGEELRLLIKDKLTQQWNREITLQSLNRHPLDVAESIIKSTVGTTQTDVASFDPASHTDISHWVCDVGTNLPWSGERAYLQKTPALDILQEHVKCTDGIIVGFEDGDVAYKRLDRSASVDRVWTHDDLIGTANVLSLYGNMQNRVTARSHEAPDSTRVARKVVPLVFEHTEQDDDSIADFQLHQGASSYDDEEDGVLTLKHIYNQSILTEDMTAVSPGVGGTFRVLNVWSNCGSRWPGYPAGSQPSDATLTASRTAYLKIEDEIIEVDQLTVSDTGKLTIGITEYTVPLVGTYRVKARGALGTTAASHTLGNPYKTGLGPHDVLDVTIPIYLARARLELFKRGLTIIERKTSLRHIDLQLGDVVTMTDPLFVKFGIDGLTSTQKWMIVAKSIPPLASGGDGAYITWRLAMINDGTTANMPNPVSSFISNAGLTASLLMHLRDESSSKNFIITGLEVTNTSGLGFDLTAGSFGNNVVRWSVPLRSYTLTASKDTYFYGDVLTGAIVNEETALGAGEPTFPARFIPIARVVTDATTITAFDDVRVRTSIGGNIVDDGTIGARNINARNEQAGLLPNGEFGTWTPPKDETLNAPDAWQTMYYIMAGPVLVTTTDQGDDYWGSSNYVYFDSTTVQTSDRSIELKADGTSGYGVNTPTTIPAQDDALYVFVVNAQGDTGGDSYYLSVRWFDSSGSFISANVVNTVVTAGSFVRQVEFIKAPSTTRFVQVAVFAAIGNAGSVFLDFVKAFRAYPAFSVVKAGPTLQSVPSGAATKIVIGASAGEVLYDHSSNWDTTNYRYVAPHDGNHSFSCSIVMQGIPSGDYVRVDLYVNGSVRKRGSTVFNASGVAEDLWATVDVDDLYLVAGDYVEFYVYHNAGVNKNLGYITSDYDNVAQGAMSQGGFG